MIDGVEFVVVDGDDWRCLRVLYQDVRVLQAQRSGPSATGVPAGCGSQLPRHQQTTCLLRGFHVHLLWP